VYAYRNDADATPRMTSQLNTFETACDLSEKQV